MKPIIKKENVKPLYESKFLNVFDLQYEEGKHYFDASRRPLSNIVAIKSDEEFKKMLPDAVTCAVIIQIGNDEPKLLLTNEYRYPTGQFLVSPPAGLLDPEDAIEGSLESPIITAAIREIKEETGLTITDSDRIEILSPLLFSSPGMTDESNALVCAVIKRDDESCLTQTGAVGSECFDGFNLVTKEEAKKLLSNGKDDKGIFYSVFTWMVMMYFISDMWR